MGDDNTKIIEFPLPGRKLDKDTNDLNLINQIGQDLYTNNKSFIKGRVKENWYGVIEPISGLFMASEDPVDLYKYTEEKHKNKLFYVIGLLKNNFVCYA